MNDLTISVAELRSNQNATRNPVPPFLCIDANDLSFRKIQAAAEPVLARLRNTGKVLEVNWTSGQSAQSLALSNIRGAGSSKVMFFGSLTGHYENNTGDTVTFEVYTYKLSKTNPLSVDVKMRGNEVKDKKIAFQVSNSFIELSTLPSGLATSQLFRGLMITLKPDTDIDINSETSALLGVSFPADAQVANYLNAARGIRGYSNEWDSTPAQNGFPSFLSPVKLGQFTNTLAGIYVGADVWGRPMVTRAIPGTVLPRNFVGFLQYIYAKYNGGVQLTLPANPATYVASSPLSYILQDIIYAVRRGVIVLGSNPKEFTLPVYNFLEEPFTPNVTGVLHSFHTLGFDPIETNSVAWNMISTDKCVYGNAIGVVSPFFPIATDTPPELIAQDYFSLSYDLVKLNIKELSVLMAPRFANGLINGDPYGILDTYDGQRSASQYAFGFNYPDPIL